MSSNIRTPDSRIDHTSTTDYQTGCTRRSCSQLVTPSITNDLSTVDVIDETGTEAQYHCPCGTEFLAEWEAGEIVETLEVSR